MNRATPSEKQNLLYNRRLIDKQTAWWKRLLKVQAPYRWNLRRLEPGLTLDIGCGIGRNLLHLGGRGVGVDKNPHSVEEAHRRGLTAYTPEEFFASPLSIPASYDSILLSHVAEHMTKAEAIALISQYLHLLKPDGKIIVITPQEAGFRSDPAHVEFMDFRSLGEIAGSIGFVVSRQYSFPFPRIAGRVFLYNEFVSVWHQNPGINP
jgi:SAM-dependent methyltransferase